MVTIKTHTGEPPSGYSFTSMFRTKAEAEKWIDAALRCKKSYPFYLTYDEGKERPYVLWRMKRKGEGKMVGKGWGELKSLKE